jgi:hypothetical protein
MAHLSLAAWLWRDAQHLAASLVAAPQAPMSDEQMIERTAGGAMMGMIVALEKSLAVVSALLSFWTTTVLARSR